jgi:hypothetical protein
LYPTSHPIATDAAIVTPKERSIILASLISRNGNALIGYLRRPRDFIDTTI